MAKKGTVQSSLRQTPTLIYPGAIGWGVETPGGRGGRIVRVTTTADGEKPGTLRYALEGLKEPRTVIFDVGGVFRFDGDLFISGPNLTVLGQTAPFPGVNIRGQLRLRTHDVFLQHLTVWGSAGNENLQQCIDILGTKEGCQRIVVDHCTLMWGWSKMLQTWSGEHVLSSGSQGVDYITVSNCLIAEPLLGPKEDSHRGLIFQEYTHHGSVLRNLFVSCEIRGPAFQNCTSVVIANNLNFNPGTASIHYWPCPDNTGPVIASIVGNVIMRGPDTRVGGSRIDLGTAYSGSRIYLRDNRAPREAVITTRSALVSEPQAWPTHMDVLSSDKVYAYLVAQAGAHPWQRESAAARVISDLQRRDSRWADTVAGYGGYPEYREVRCPLALPPEPGKIGADGYSNLERWVWNTLGQLKPRLFIPSVRSVASHGGQASNTHVRLRPAPGLQPDDLDLSEALVLRPARNRAKGK